MARKVKRKVVGPVPSDDREVLDRIEKLVARTPAEHIRGLVGELQAINEALARLGFDQTSRETNIQEIWERLWVVWTGYPYHYHLSDQSEKAGVVVVSIPTRCLEHVENFEPTSECLRSHAQLVRVAAENVVGEQFKSLGLKLADHLTGLADDLAVLGVPHQVSRKSKDGSNDNVKEVAEVKAAREGRLRAVQEATLRIQPLSEALIESVLNTPSHGLASLGKDGLMEVELLRDPMGILASGADEENDILEISGLVVMPWLVPRSVDEESRRRTERRDVGAFREFMRQRSSAGSEAGIESGLARQAKAWEEYSYAFYFFAQAVAELDAANTLTEARRISKARKLAWEKLRAYIAISKNIAALGSWKRNVTEGSSDMSKRLTRESLRVHADRLKSFRLP